jgi:hypothetical protein
MHRVEFVPPISVFERAKTLHALGFIFVSRIQKFAAYIAVFHTHLRANSRFQLSSILERVPKDLSGFQVHNIFR